MSKPPKPQRPRSDREGLHPLEVETTGHEWDGIREYNNPLPRWWLWTFYATTIWGLLYTIAYPAWPLVSEATPGILGFSTREDVEVDIRNWMDSNAALEADLATVDLAALGEDEDLYHYAIQSGAAVFRNNCSQCHGSGAGGAVGYPNLLDDDWLWGGTLDEIAWTVRHGIRNEQSPDARYSEMPAWGPRLTDAQVNAVAAYVHQLGGGEVVSD